MTHDARSRLLALLMRWTVRDIRELPADVRGQMLDVLAYEAAERGISRDGTSNQLGRELDELADALGVVERDLTSSPSDPDEDVAARQ